MYIRKRLEKLKKLLCSKGINSYLEFEAKNIYYLTGFDAAYLLLVDKYFYLVVNSMVFEQAKNILEKNNILDLFKIIVISSEKNIDYEYTYETVKSFLISTKISNNIKTLYYSDKNISFSMQKILENIFILKSSEPLVNNMRMIKDDLELKFIEFASKKTEEIAREITKFFDENDLTTLKNISENEIAKKIDLLSIKYCGDIAFKTITAFYKNTFFPHYIPSENVFINEKEPFIFLSDFGAKYNEYCSDKTVSLFKNLENSDNCNLYKKMFSLVKLAHDEAISIIRPGIKAKDLDILVREIFNKNEMLKYFIHSTGHGTGLDIHERPNINYLSETVLKENMVITIEPGLYIKNIGGVRIEDTILITKNGYKILTKI